MNHKEILQLIDAQLPITEDDIRSRAKQLWLADGSPSGDGVSYWLLAENQLIASRQQVSQAILKKVVRPVTQEAAASIQDEAQRYCKSACTVLQQELLANQQLVLPEGVRFHKRVGKVDYLVIEQQPMLRTVLVDMRYHKNRYGSDRYGEGDVAHQQKRIALPYVIYQITLADYQLQNFYMAFRNEPLKTLKDSLGLSILPNSHEGGTVCCPFDRHSQYNIVDAVSHVIGFYWQSEYRYCLHNYIPNHPAFKSWEAWEKVSAENPLFVLKVDWSKLPLTLADILKTVATDALPTPPAAFQDLSSKFIRSASEILSIKEPPKELTVEEIVHRDLDLCLENIKKGIWPEGMYRAQT